MRRLRELLELSSIGQSGALQLWALLGYGAGVGSTTTGKSFRI